MNRRVEKNQQAARSHGKAIQKSAENAARVRADLEYLAAPAGRFAASGRRCPAGVCGFFASYTGCTLWLCLRSGPGMPVRHTVGTEELAIREIDEQKHQITKNSKPQTHLRGKKHVKVSSIIVCNHKMCLLKKKRKSVRNMSPSYIQLE